MQARPVFPTPIITLPSEKPSIDCPRCGSSLKGDFQFGEELHCPNCLNDFFTPTPDPNPNARQVPKGAFRPRCVFVASACWAILALSNAITLAFPIHSDKAVVFLLCETLIALDILIGHPSTRRTVLLLSSLGVSFGTIIAFGDSMHLKEISRPIDSMEPVGPDLLPGLLTFAAHAICLYAITRPRAKWWFGLPRKIPLP